MTLREFEEKLKDLGCTVILRYGNYRVIKDGQELAWIPSTNQGCYRFMPHEKASDIDRELLVQYVEDFAKTEALDRGQDFIFQDANKAIYKLNQRLLDFGVTYAFSPVPLADIEELKQNTLKLLEAIDKMESMDN